MEFEKDERSTYGNEIDIPGRTLSSSALLILHEEHDVVGVFFYLPLEKFVVSCVLTSFWSETANRK